MRKFVISGPKHSSMTFNKSRALQVVGQNFVIRFCNGCKHVFPYFFGVKQWIFLKMEKISRDTLISTINTKFELPNPSRCWDMAANTFFRIFFGVKQWNFVKMEKNSGDTLISTIHTKFELPNPSRCWDMAANTFFTFFRISG